MSDIQGKNRRAGIRSGGIGFGFLDCNAGVVSDHARNGIVVALKYEVTIAGMLDRLLVFLLEDSTAFSGRWVLHSARSETSPASGAA
jgi:hypothetical protein